MPPEHEQFPETDEFVLERAAEGDWQDFLRLYLPGCWREVVINCRCRGIQIADAEDHFQELCARLIRDGNYGPAIRASLESAGSDGSFQGNIPARYIRSRNSPLASSRFRTYLKGVIRHVISEAVRRQSRLREQSAAIGDPDEFATIDESACFSVDREWIVSCLSVAAERLKAESASSSTKGRQRWYEILALSTGLGLSVSEIAAEYGIDASTASESLKQARSRFVMLLEEVSNFHSTADLLGLLEQVPEALHETFREPSSRSR